jgi:hypothetical protein
VQQSSRQEEEEEEAEFKSSEEDEDEDEETELTNNRAHEQAENSGSNDLRDPGNRLTLNRQ